jgi:hypothetical protein
VVEAIDLISLQAGKFLRNEPVARLGFLLYLVLLHLWALCVLALHSQNLEKLHADAHGASPTDIVIPGHH